MSLCLIWFDSVQWLDKYKKLSLLIKDRGKAPFPREVQSQALLQPSAVIPTLCVNCKALLEMLWEKDARSHAVRLCAWMLLCFILMQQLLYIPPQRSQKRRMKRRMMKITRIIAMYLCYWLDKSHSTAGLHLSTESCSYCTYMYSYLFSADMWKMLIVLDVYLYIFVFLFIHL